MTKDIENNIKSCNVCLKQSYTNPKKQLTNKQALPLGQEIYFILNTRMIYYFVTTCHDFPVIRKPMSATLKSCDQTDEVSVFYIWDTQRINIW